jgi:hypothetical protein
MRGVVTVIVIAAVTFGCWWEVRARLSSERVPLRQALADVAISVFGAAIVAWALIVLLVRPL